MKAICENELVIDCTRYKAIDSGVILMGDDGDDNQDVIAFIPNGKLEYLLPDEVVEREHERLGVPAPELTSPEDLEPRLDEFADEVDELRETLDSQVEDLIDEDAAVEETDSERQERLRERRREIDRSLQQVRQRAEHLQQLSVNGSGAGSEDAGSEDAEPADAESEDAGSADAESEDAEPADDIEALRAEMDDRFETIERHLQTLASTTDGVSEELAVDEDAEPDDELDRVNGLGSTYRGRLHDADIDTLGDLVDHGPGEVADAVNVSETRASDWVDQAEEILEDRQTDA